MSISLKRQFEIRLTGVTTEVCGVQFPGAGRRQLVPCPEGEIIGPDFHGSIMSAGIDHQLIRDDGTAEINASYGFRLDDGRSLYVHVEGIRTVPPEYAEDVKNDRPVDPKLFYYVTTPKVEVYDESLAWMTRTIFVCEGTRLPDAVLLTYYSVEQVNDHPALG